MENSEKFYSTRKLIRDTEVSEIDCELDKELGFDYDTFEEHVEIKLGNGGSDSEPIQIDWLLRILNELKEKGSTHVAIEYHVDHIGYQIDGYEIRKSTQSEIDEYVSAKLIKKKTQEKINSLKQQIRKLETGY